MRFLSIVPLVVALAFFGGNVTSFVSPKIILKGTLTRDSSPPLSRFVPQQHATTPHTMATIPTVDVSEDAPRDIRTMEEWASACGVQRSNGFELVGGTVDGTLDISARTTEPLSAQSPVLYVPNVMILSSRQAMAEFGRLEEAERQLRDDFSHKVAEVEIHHYYLMIKLLYEWERGESSPWYHYLNSLPRKFFNGASMTPFCYKCIPPFVASLSKEERVRLNRLSIKQVPFLSVETRGNADLWKWAFQIATTRSLPSTNNDQTDNSRLDLRIVPMVDVFNHGTTATVEIAYDDMGNCHVRTTDQDLPPGAPLQRTYADTTNPSFLLARYGFLDETAPATFCKLLPKHISDKLRTLGYAHNKLLFYKDSGEVSPEVWDVLLFLLLGEKDAVSEQERFYAAHCQGDLGLKKAMLEHYFPEIAMKLLEHIDAVLVELDELSEKMQGISLKDHPRLPLILRHNDFVRQTFLVVKSRYFGG